MGVLGLTPFLQKTCPGVIKSIPDRLRGLTGKRIVIDGTLITQRLHFAPIPHQYRHVLGWYRLAKELEESGVTAVCVFDGKERNRAKARESFRRKEAHQLVVARSSLELKRLRRLQRLESVWQRWQALDHTDRNHVSNLIKALDIPKDITVLLENTRVPLSSTECPLSEEDVVDQGTNEDDLHGYERPVTRPVENYSAESLPYSSFQDTLLPSYDRIQDQPFPVITEPEQGIRGILPSEIPRAIASLFLDYRTSVSQLASLPSTSPEIPPFSLLEISVDLTARTDLLMSKAQIQLTLEEGQLWTKIFAFQDYPESATDIGVNQLAERSGAMSASYLRRADTPTAKTYDESREILQAMGIPCIESTGAFEAEALASAIVCRGQADYVASEDTDVLVYEVPLLRNLTNRNEPLMMMCGADIRAVLELGRESFIDFALLLGTDFSERIKNIGPSRALKFIKEYGSIERVIESEVKYPPRLSTKAYLAQVESARMVFRTLPSVPDEVEMAHRPRDDAEVVQLLQRFSLGREVLQHETWNYEAALAGNYFADNPKMY
ncbi:PIN domain-like protein [Amanita muscaria]